MLDSLVLKKKLIIFLLGLHLLLIAVGTCLFDFSRVPSVLQPYVSVYLALIGGHSYAFFSPDVPRQVVAHCLVTDSAGDKQIITYGWGRNTAELRATYLIQFLDNVTAPEVAAKLLAEESFKRCPHARSIQVLIGYINVPAVKDYKLGARNSFELEYHETFYHE